MVIGPVSMRSSLIFSEISCRSFSDTSPYTATVIAGYLLIISVITGSSASSGKVSIRSTSVFISSSVLCISASLSSSTVTEPLPSWAVEIVRDIPSIPLILSSIFMQTPSSTSSGLAPG